MSDIIKVCKKHGELTIDKVQRHKRNGKYSLECHECTKSYHKKAYEKQKQFHKSKLASGEYENTIPEKTCKIHGILPPEKIQVRGKYQKCRICMGFQCRKWEKTYPAKVKKNRDKNYSRNRSTYRKKSVLKNKELTMSKYDSMFIEQYNKCYICNREETKKFRGEVQALCVDHDHVTGKVRKLLCHHCNSGLGHFREDTEILWKAIKYLKEFSNDYSRTKL